MFIAAGMVEEDWLKVAAAAMALGLGLYLIPLAMIAEPALIRLETAPGAALLAAAKTAVALGFVSFGVIAPKSMVLRAALIVAGGVLLFAPLPG